MAWYNLDGWDAGGVGAEIASKGLDRITSSLNNLIKTANDLVKQETITAIQTHEMAKAWDKVTTALYDELTIIEKQTGNQMVLARIDTVKTSLANIDWYNDFTSTVKPMAVKIEGIAKNLGTTVAAAEVLWEMKDPNVTSFELGSTAMGALTGVLVGAAILSFPITGAWALGAAAIGGVMAGMSGKYLWETGIAPALGLSETNSPLFWNSLSDYLGLSPISIADVKTAVLDLFDNGQLVRDPINPTTFDLSVDPSGLKPTNPDSLGSSTHGWGLLAGGAGYTAAASSTYVNSDGLVNTALSNIVADGIRPGNHSLNKTTDLANALRATNFGNTLSQGTGQMVLTNLPAGAANSLSSQLISNQHDGQTTTFTGTLHFDGQGRTIAITPNAGSVAYVNGQRVVFDGRSDVILSPNQNHLTNGGLAAGWFVQSHDAEGRQLQLTYDGKSLIYTDPLSLDAGNDGIRMSATPVNFDLNADGSPEAVSWTAPTDPLLVLDVNGDGRINHGSELVDLTNGDVPLNLFSLDSLDKGGNGDQILNANDSAFAQLQLWTDRNQDGYASAEERQSLTDLGIVSIDLNPTHLQTSTVANPIAGQTGIKGVVATYADGSHKTLWDLPLLPNANSSAPITSSAYGTSGAIDKITGSGQTALVAKSAFGVTVDLNNSGATQAIGSFGNDTLIGTNGDDWLTGGAGADSFNAGAGADLLIIDADDQQANIDAGAGIDTVLVTDDRGVFLNLAKTHSEVIYGGYGDDVFVGGGADNYFIDGAAGADLIIGGSVDDVLSGGDGADVLEGLAGDDLIRGHRGQDQLLGGDGNDVLDGGLDNDSLQAGNGNDVIIAGGGTDTVDGGSGIDIIELQGHLEDYSFVHNDTVANGSWTITDHKNNDGKPVPAGQVSNRNGVQQINHVERFSFMSGQTPTAKALKIAA